MKKEILQKYKAYLEKAERSVATIGKYLSDVSAFLTWLGKRKTEKEIVLRYKEALAARYAPASVNAALASLNSFFSYLGREDLRVKSLKMQRKVFSSPEKELSRAEYERLLAAAKKKKNQRLYLLMQTVCTTGIRVSELCFVTVKAVWEGRAEVKCKGKHRTVFLPKGLCKILREYSKAREIKEGPVFVTKNGRPLDRSNIWSDMKKLCAEAGVSEKKVFPHNLRHLFARTYYGLQKDIVRLADILGHASINTTRIYTMESGEIHRRQIEKLGLLLC